MEHSTKNTIKRINLALLNKVGSIYCYLDFLEEVLTDPKLSVSDKEYVPEVVRSLHKIKRDLMTHSIESAIEDWSTLGSK